MKLAFLTIPGLILALSGSALASETWQDQSVRTGLAAMNSAPLVTSGTVRGIRVPAVRLPAGSPSFFVGFLASGPAVQGVPCFGCVNGAPASALGIPPPYNYIPSGTVQQYNVAWTDLTFNGTCKVYITVASGKTVIGKASYSVPGITAPGAYDIGLNLAASTFSGSAMATGKVVCGGKSSSTSAPVIFQ